MSLPKKEVIQITEKELPEPFATYWNSPEKLDRDFKFYLVDGELYIEEFFKFDNPDEERLLKFWSDSSCCGISLYVSQLNLPEHSQKPLVRKNGNYLFIVVYTAEYETSVIDLTDGKIFVVHSG